MLHWTQKKDVEVVDSSYAMCKIQWLESRLQFVVTEEKSVVSDHFTHCVLFYHFFQLAKRDGLDIC